MRTVFPFFWQAQSTVPALENLSPEQVLQQADVTGAVGGDPSGGHRLLVTALADGKVIGDLQLVATSDDVVIGDMQSVFGRDMVKNHHALRRRRFRLPKYRSGTALLLGASNSDNYYHWLIDSLPRWRMLQAAGWKDFDFVLLHSRSCAFQDETLDWLGVPATRRLHCSKNFVHQFERLVVPAMPFARKTVPAWVAPWLRSLVPPTSAGAEKIFLSRRGAPGRQVTNEAELQLALEARGFVTLQPEKYCVLEQAQRLAGARWIVAPHGAALANMVFAPPGARVIEFFHPRHKNRCYENLAAASGHRYASLDGQANESAEASRLQYSVDIPAVIAALEETSEARRPAPAISG